MSNIFTISDNHFFHKNIIEYCSRPFESVSHMNWSMVHKWNSVVTPDDFVVHVGDFAFRDKEGGREILSVLNGYKTLILGNHDRSRSAMLEMGFNDVHKGPYQLYHRGCKFVFNHKPLFKELESDYGVGLDNYFHIFGHVHNKTPKDTPSWAHNVSVEVIDYTPKNLDSFID